MGCSQGQDDSQDQGDKQDTTQDQTAQGNTARENTAGDDTAGNGTERDDTERKDTGRDENANPLASLSSAEQPVRELNAIDKDLQDLEEATGEMAHRLRKGDSEGLVSLLRMAHLAVRGLRRDLGDVREHIRNRFG